MLRIPFNKSLLEGEELNNLLKAAHSGQISGDGFYTEECQKFLEKKLNAPKVILTTSGTHALELATLLLDTKEGDEVILPSFTFSSTANAFILRGAKPVFVDIRKDAKNIDENLIEEKITHKTKAIIPVHYAGVSCDMVNIMEISKKYNLSIVEDAAHACGARYKGHYLGTIGTFGCFSFHESKNLVCGEGGALIINDKRFIERAEMIRDKGTNRSRFLKGQVDKYTWVDIGSSYSPSNLLSAILLAQLKKMDDINKARKKIYEEYYQNLKDLEKEGKIELPFISEDCSSNFHIFYIMLKSQSERDGLIEHLKKNGISSYFHYIPLHSSPMGLTLGYKKADLPVTEDVSNRLLRLPLYNDMKPEEQSYVIDKIKCYFK